MLGGDSSWHGFRISDSSELLHQGLVMNICHGETQGCKSVADKNHDSIIVYSRPNSCLS